MVRVNRRRLLAASLGLAGSLGGCLRLDDQENTPTDGGTGTNAAGAATATPRSDDDSSTPTVEEGTSVTAEEPEDATGGQRDAIGGSWPQFQVDAGNGGHHPNATGPKSMPDERWTFTTFDNFVVDMNPIVADGLLVVGSNDQHVYAVSANDGTEAWSHDVGGQVWGTPAYHDGTVVIGSGPEDDQKAFTAFDLQTGEVRWEQPLNANQLSPAVHDGNAYFASGELVAVDIASGSMQWRQDVSGKTSPAVLDGTVYVGSGGARPTDSGAGRVFAFDAADGSSVWRARIDEKVTKRCHHTAAEGTVFVGGHQGTLFALDAADGEERWQFSVGDGILSSPAVVDGVAYVGSGHWEAAGRHVYALNVDDGSERWRFDAGTQVFSSPAVADGVVYVGDTGGTVIALDAADGSLRWRASVGASVNAAPVVLDGVLYAASRDGIVHALQESS